MEMCNYGRMKVLIIRYLRANGVLGRIIYGGTRGTGGGLALSDGGDDDVTLWILQFIIVHGQVGIDTGTTVNQTSGFYYSGYFTGQPLMVDIVGSSAHSSHTDTSLMMDFITMVV